MWLKILEDKYKPDEVVFLGDYFDRFHDTPENAKVTATWLKQSLEKPNRIHLLGNHDMPYMVPGNAFLWCPGFTKEKCKAIAEVMTQEDWDKIRPAYFTNEWMLSHAGFHPHLVEHPVTGIPDAAGLIALAEEGLKAVKGGLEHPLFQYGDRMGEKQIGGITWLDWYAEFVPLDRFSQIVGHTRTTFPIQMEDNWLIDCGLQELALITNGNVEIIENDTLGLHI